MQHLIQLTNEVVIADDGWAQLAPFGDFPGVAFTNDGPKPATQKVDREAGESLVRSVLSLTGRASRFFRSVPIFNGHPDVPALKGQYPDAEPRGYIGDIAVRDDGIFIRPILNEAGAALLNSGEKLGLSAYVDAEILGESDGKVVARWSRLRSAGLTPHPNLPVQLMNSKLNSPGQPENQQMNQQVLIAALAAVGVSIANSATEDAVVAAIRTLAEQRNNAVTTANARDTELAALKTERDGFKTKLTEAETALANSEASRRKDLIDQRVADGAIAEADRSVWDDRLKANFANESTALRAIKGTVLKTESTVANAGARRGTSADAGTAEHFIIAYNDALKAGKKPEDALRGTIAQLPNSYAAWRESDCSKLN